MKDHKTISKFCNSVQNVMKQTMLIFALPIFSEIILLSTASFLIRIIVAKVVDSGNNAVTVSAIGEWEYG